MERITEGRRANAVYILGQIKGFLETLKSREGYDIASVFDVTARQFAQALTEAGASDPYAVIRAVDEISRVRGTGPIYTRIYRKYFHAPIDMSPQEVDAVSEEGFEDGVDQAEDSGVEWPEEIKMGTQGSDDIGGEGDYFADDDFDMDEPFEDPQEKVENDLYNSYYKESAEDFVNGEDEFTRAYDDADEFLGEGWPREQVEVYLMDNYKSLRPEDIDEIVSSISLRDMSHEDDGYDAASQNFEHPVEDF